MSRVAKNPIQIPANVQVNISNDQVHVKGPKGEQVFSVHPSVKVVQEANELKIVVLDEEEGGDAQGGTARAILNNMVHGVGHEFTKQLELIGVGYRAAMQGTNLKLNLGFSHDVIYFVPKGIHIETPSQTEITVRGVSKHLVGQVAANIRSYRPPEPYKGKGIRYKGEKIVMKEGKKQ